MAGVIFQVDPDEAREEARDILGQRRFEPTRVPRPFEGPLEWLGDRLEPVGDLIGRLADSWLGQLVLAAITVAAVVMVTLLIVRRHRRGVAHGRPSRHHDVERSLDPARLEAAADAAERDGELDRAVRLRFRAGLLRLDAAGAIRFRPSITTGQVARRLRLRRFDDLALTFDGVAYGGKAASADDVAAARAGWPRVLEELRR